MFCGNCGTEINEGELFCGNCGTRIEIPQIEQISEFHSPNVSVNDMTNTDLEVQPSEDTKNSETSQLYQIISEKNNETARLASDIELIIHERNQANEKLRLLQNTAGKLKGWLIAFIVLFVGTVLFGIYQYNTVQSQSYQISSLTNRNNNLTSKNNELTTQLNNVIKNMNVRIDSLLIGNSDKNSNWLTFPGGKLYANQMRYLRPEVTLTSFIPGNLTFYIKKIRPDGSVVIDDVGTNSGFSYSDTINVRQGDNQKFVLTGWGNESSSSYTTGTWEVEIWYNGVCLKSQEVILN
jgi:cell division protein FtsB